MEKLKLGKCWRIKKIGNNNDLHKDINTCQFDVRTEEKCCAEP